MTKPSPIRAIAPQPAVPEGPPPVERTSEPPTTAGGGDVPGPPYNGLPPQSPITALGHKDNEIYYFIAPNGGLKPIRDEKFTKNKFLSLYNGNLAYLEALWPRIGKRGDVNGFDAEMCVGDHMKACTDAGPFDPVNSMRGAGAWRGTHGKTGGALIWNFGDAVLVKPRDGAEIEAPTRKIGHHIYQLRPPMLRPGPIGSGTPAAAKELLKSLATWSWARPELDPMLLLGWIAGAMIGGALAWRPMIWITGEKGSGKSTIMEKHGYFDHIFGPDAGVFSTNATAAGLYQRLQFDSLPCVLDELEPKPDNRKVGGILEIAMQSSSGGATLRGGQDHTGIEFQSRSPFAFSSINVSALSSALISRMAILELGALAEGAKRSGILPLETLERIGMALRRRLIDLWPQWDDRFVAWHEGLMRMKHASRTADQFGTLLAAAHLALEDKPASPAEIDRRLADWNMKQLAEQADDTPDWQACLNWLLTKSILVIRGAQTTIARLIQIALGRVARADPDPAKAEHDQHHAREALIHYGLKLLQRPDPNADGRDAWYLAVAQNTQTLTQHFEGSHWAGASGAVPVYVKTLRRVPGALWGEKDHVNTLHFNGHAARVTLLPLDLILPEQEG